MHKFDVEMGDVKKLEEWLREHVTTPEDAMALTLVTFTMLYHAYTVPRPTRQQTIDRAVEAIKSLRIAGVMEDDTASVSELPQNFTEH